MEKQKTTNLLLLAILLCLVLISCETSSSVVPQTINLETDTIREEVIQLAPNRIALVASNAKIFVFDYDDEEKIFILSSVFEYEDYLLNSHKYIKDLK